MKRTLIATVLVLLTAAPAWAGTADVTARVVRTLVDSQYWGGCMAQVNVPLRNVLGGCKGDWMSFSCTGDFNPSEVGYRKLEAAQLALVTETNITATIENTKLHNGYCFARRVDNRAP